MVEHIFFPNANLLEISISPTYEEWLFGWLCDTEQAIEDGVVSSSLCLQVALAEVLFYGEFQTDWRGIFNSYLKDDSGRPLAYSENFGEKLYKFSHWNQVSMHAIHTHWWIEKEHGVAQEDLSLYFDLTRDLIQPSGWIYNPSVSDTRLRNRMRSELMMSLAMGIEIMTSFRDIQDNKAVFEAALSSQPMTGYLSAEYFRLRSLEMINSQHLIPHNLAEVLTMCEAQAGYCDFSLESKRDTYMGVAKRGARDQELHSAISCLHSLFIADFCEDPQQTSARERTAGFISHLRKNPFDTPSFKMRDIETPFGPSFSPLELLAASILLSMEDTDDDDAAT